MEKGENRHRQIDRWIKRANQKNLHEQSVKRDASSYQDEEAQEEITCWMMNEMMKRGEQSK
jgi:hypothetical protein